MGADQFDQGHGTHTGGTSSSETYGVAKDVTIVGVKVLGCDGNAPDADSIQGIDWVTQNAQSPAVANASWTSGGAGADPEGIMRAIRNPGPGSPNKFLDVSKFGGGPRGAH